MGALPQARVLLAGDRLDVEWPELACCAGLVATCRLRDGTAHVSGTWVRASDSRFGTTCGPLAVEVEVQPRDGHVCMSVEATARAEIDVVQVALSGRVAMAGVDLAWVLYNGYQSWDPA